MAEHGGSPLLMGGSPDVGQRFIVSQDGRQCGRDWSHGRDHAPRHRGDEEQNLDHGDSYLAELQTDTGHSGDCQAHRRYFKRLGTSLSSGFHYRY